MKEKTGRERYKYLIAVESDLEPVMMLLHKTWLATYAVSGIGISRDDVNARFDPHSSEGSARYARMRERFNSANMHCVLAKGVAGDIAGIGIARRGEGHNFIESVYVDPSHQGQGVGHRILETLIAWLRLEDKPISLYVAAQNEKAIEFYAGHGFQINLDSPLSSHQETALPSGIVIPEVEMILKKD